MIARPRVSSANAALALSVLAVTISLTGVTPGDAARAVKRALTADTVDGLSASKTPAAGKLLPLGRDKRFPVSVIPALAVARGPRGGEGPRGPEGPPGQMGPTGPSEGRQASVSEARPLSLDGGLVTEVARLDNIVAGSYLLTARANLAWFPGSTAQAEHACQITVNGAGLGAASASLGNAPGSAYVGNVAPQVLATLATPSSVVLACGHFGNVIPGPAPYAFGIRLVAIRVGSATG